MLYRARNPDTADNKQHTSSTGCVLPSSWLQAKHACRPPAEQETTSRVCGSLPALYRCGFLLIRTSICFLSDIATSKAGGLCCCVIHACCNKYNTAAATAAVRFSWAAERGRQVQSLLWRILCYFFKYYPTAVQLCSVCRACMCAVCSVCRESRVECFQTFFFLPSATLGFVRKRPFLRRGRHNKVMR